MNKWLSALRQELPTLSTLLSVFLLACWVCIAGLVMFCRRVWANGRRS